MPNYAPRITLPYDDVSGVISVWSGYCDQMAVYEHDADLEVNKTHVHMIMINCSFKTAEPLKRRFYEQIKTDRKGNDLWEWEHKNYPNPDIGYIKYMSKGTLTAKFVKNISEQVLEEWRQKWTPDIPKAPILRQTSLDEDAKKKLTKYAVVLEVVKLILAKHPTATEVQKQAILIDADSDSVLKNIRKVLIQDNQVLGLYKVIDIYDAYVMYYQKEKFLENCRNVLLKRQPRI